MHKQFLDNNLITIHSKTTTQNLNNCHWGVCSSGIWHRVTG